MLSRPMFDRIAFAGISWYAILIVAAIALGALLAARETRRRGLSDDLIVDFLLLAIPLGIVGARLYYVFFRWNEYRDDLLSILALREGGLAIYGGILGGVAAARIVCRRHRISLWALLDAIAPSLALGQAIGRWGNYINMEAYGLRLSNPALQRFPIAVEVPVGQIWYWHLATFFFESMVCLAIFALLLFVRRHRRRTGDVFLWYLLLYTAARTVIEGLRDDSLTFLSDFVRISQVLSGWAAFALVVHFFLRIRDRMSLVTVMPVVTSLACLALTFLGEFERNAYSTLFFWSQLLCAALVALMAASIVLWTLDSGHYAMRDNAPPLFAALLLLVVFLSGMGRANADNTFYVTWRQIAAMLSLLVCAWQLYAPFCGRQEAER